jgi:hypothetical protein
MEPAAGATAAYAGPSAGLVGDSTSLILHVSRPSRHLSYEGVAGLASVNTRTSDLVSVSYFLAIPGAAGLQGAVGDRYSNAIRDSSVQGLARLEGDKMAIEFADTGAGLESLADAAQVIAPEVIELTFRYFDGSTWYDTWDSAALGALPRAVEVVIGLKTPQKPRDPSDSRPVDSPTVGRSIRHVIAIPLSSAASAPSTTEAATDTSSGSSGATGQGTGSGGQPGDAGAQQGTGGQGTSNGGTSSGGATQGGVMNSGFSSGAQRSTRGGLR